MGSQADNLGLTGQNKSDTNQVDLLPTEIP